MEKNELAMSYIVSKLAENHGTLTISKDDLLAVELMTNPKLRSAMCVAKIVVNVQSDNSLTIMSLGV